MQLLLGSLKTIKATLGRQPIDKAVDDFTADFEKLHGKGSTMMTI